MFFTQDLPAFFRQMDGVDNELVSYGLLLVLLEQRGVDVSDMGSPKQKQKIAEVAHPIGLTVDRVRSAVWHAQEALGSSSS